MTFTSIRRAANGRWCPAGEFADKRRAARRASRRRHLRHAPCHAISQVAVLREEREVARGFGSSAGVRRGHRVHGLHADGKFNIERRPEWGAYTADMVEGATGLNLWAEWAALEAARGTDSYRLPPLKQRYGGVVMSLARQEQPDTSGFNDPEIIHRADTKHHIGFVLNAETPLRVEQLLTSYMDRIGRDFHAAMPAADKVSH
ncbi:MAG: hypothetical protein U0792_04300 [Gemmataceae bacterium]